MRTCFEAFNLIEAVPFWMRFQGDMSKRCRASGVSTYFARLLQSDGHIWRKVLVIPVHKKESRMLCTNYRGISL